MATWSRSPKSNDWRFKSDPAGFQNLGAFDAILGSNGQLGSAGRGLDPLSSRTSMGPDSGMTLQPPPLSMAPPLPPPSLDFINTGSALYSSLPQQHQHKQLEVPTSSTLSGLGGVEFGRPQNTTACIPFGSLDHGRGHSGADRRAFDLSESMLFLNVGTETLNRNEHGAIGGSKGWGDNSALLRDQMNAQMAALYQQPKPHTTNELLSCPQPQETETDNRMLRNNNGIHGKDMSTPDNDERTMSLLPMQLERYPSLSASSLRTTTGLAPATSPSRTSHSRSSTPSRSRRSPAQSPQLHHEHVASTALSGGQHNSIYVSPEVAKPNETIKVQVSLDADECAAGRVLLVGLFRLGQPTNDKPIFVKQVLFENKLYRNYRYLNTRITFRAPRSPGEFEFRVFQDQSGHESHYVNGKRAEDEPHGKGMVYSNLTLTRSNRLKVCLDYSHFIDTLRATYDKFQQGKAHGDAGLVLSALLALLRLVDQVETVFLHGHALFGEMLEACLGLLERPVEDIAQSFAATESIPQPIETLHGTLRNVLNAIEANKYVRDLVVDHQLAAMAQAQRERFCQVSGLFFTTTEARAAYWLDHFGFAPIHVGPSNSYRADRGTKLHTSAFVTQALTRWVHHEATRLMPEPTAFRASRQLIYDQVHANVIANLSFPCTLDVFGSSANEFGLDQSDMDMCLVLPSEHGVVSVEDKQGMLLQVVTRLQARPDLFTSIDTTRLTARVPIIMFVSRDVGIECDLGVENRLAQRNTSLLRAYASADPRVRVLAYVLKHFVKQRRMNCAAEGTLSSYGYLLLLIHFLQRQDPPVLPVLQRLPPNWPSEPQDSLPSVLCRGPSDEGMAASKGLETYFYDPFAFHEPRDKVALLRDYGSRNTQTVGELLVAFLCYFGLQFDATRYVVSINCHELTKDDKRHSSQWRFTTRLSIEDPFEVSYDVAHVLKGARDKYIRQQFVRAYVLLMDGAKQAERRSDSDQRKTDAAVDRIMAMINEHVLEVPCVPVPPPSTSRLSPGPRP